MAFRDRIVELRRDVRAGDLIPDPRNWRRHPEGQRRALTRVLERLGLVTALVARDSPEGLVLVDGHLRADLDPEQRYSVIVTDLSEEEAAVALVTLDPLAALAEPDDGALQEIILGLDDDILPVDAEELFPDLPIFDVAPLPPNEYPQMDKTKLTTCPNCGHEFERK